MSTKPVVLLILDGYGINDKKDAMPLLWLRLLLWIHL